MKEEKNTNKVMRWISRIVTILLVLAIAVCIYMVFQLMRNGFVEIGGYRMFRVVTGSMEPTMSVGTLLISKQVDLDTVQTNDIVCFYSYDSRIYGSVMTHRVVDVIHDSQGILLQTKGDANLVADGYYVSKENFIGKVIWYTGEKNVLTTTFSFLTEEVGFLGCIVIPCLLVAGLILQNSVKNIRNDLKNAEKETELKQQSEQNPESTISAQEYEEMLSRIRDELTKELLQQSPAPEGEHHVGILEEEQTDTSK